MILISNKRAFHSHISLSGTEKKEGKIKVEPDNWIHELQFSQYEISAFGIRNGSGKEAVR